MSKKIMNPRQFFTSNTWWGKIIGALLGYLMAGPSGALFGVLVGNFFDKGLYEHFSNPHWYYHSEKRKSVQTVFFETTFSIMGYLAKADGRVSNAEIHVAKTLMNELELNTQQRQLAIAHFNAGKQSDFDLMLHLSKLKEALANNGELLKLFIDIEYRAIAADGLTVQKIQAFDKILNYFGLASLNQQHRFYQDFYNTNYQHSKKTPPPHYSAHASLDQAYAILEISPQASKQEVTKAYRRLISKHHPDKLIAKGLPEEMIKLANEKTQTIRKAYEAICANKGW